MGMKNAALSCHNPAMAFYMRECITSKHKTLILILVWFGDYGRNWKWPTEIYSSLFPMTALLYSVSQPPLQLDMGISHSSHKQTEGKRNLPFPVLNFKILDMTFLYSLSPTCWLEHGRILDLAIQAWKMCRQWQVSPSSLN